MSNSIGTMFRVMTFGESHGVAVGCVIDGMPAGMALDAEDINVELRRRRPGQSAFTTPRKEADTAAILSGVFHGKTTGTPIAVLIQNGDAHSTDYEALKDLYRPSHADFTYWQKYGVRDWRGGGRASARETAARVAAGAVAQKCLRDVAGMEFLSHAVAVGDVAHNIDVRDFATLTRSTIEQSSIRCPYPEGDAMEAAIRRAAQEGDSVGCVVCGLVTNVPAGLGEPMFDKLSASLARAMFTINAVKGFDLGNGFAAAALRGSENNDAFISKDGSVVTEHNRNGGILGGISTGEPIYFRVAFKPTPTIAKDQQTVDVHGNPVILRASGRHDPCLAARAVPVVDAMAAITLMDLFMTKKG